MRDADKPLPNVTATNSDPTSRGGGPGHDKEVVQPWTIGSSLAH